MADEKSTGKVEKAQSPFQEPFQPFGKKSLSATEPVVGPDGHVFLSQEDIDAQKEAE